jgi:hypothetical protein
MLYADEIPNLAIRTLKAKFQFDEITALFSYYTIAIPPQIAITNDKFNVIFNPTQTKIIPPVANASKSDIAEAVVFIYTFPGK